MSDFVYNKKKISSIKRVRIPEDRDLKKGLRLNRNERVNFYLIGILKNLSENEISERNIEKGVKISEFNREYQSYWEEYGIKENDIIKKINSKIIFSVSDVENIMKTRNYYDPISIEILTSDNKIERFNFR